MEEFVFKDETEDLMELIGPSKIGTCWDVVNAENLMDPNRSYCYPSMPPREVPINNRVREQAAVEAFHKGLDKYVWPKRRRKKK